MLVQGNVLQSKFQERVQQSLQSHRPPLIIGYQAMAIAMYDARERLMRVPHGLPVLVLHGKNDRMVDYAASREIFEYLPQARRFLPHVDDPEAYGHFWLLLRPEPCVGEPAVPVPGHGRREDVGR